MSLLNGISDVPFCRPDPYPLKFLVACLIALLFWLLAHLLELANSQHWMGGPKSYTQHRPSNKTEEREYDSQLKKHSFVYKSELCPCFLTRLKLIMLGGVLVTIESLILKSSESIKKACRTIEGLLNFVD